MQFLDCLGLACPQPVILCRSAVDNGVECLEVLVDNEPALENVQRFLQGRGYTLSATQEGPQQWRIRAAVDAAAAGASVLAAPEARDGQEQDLRTLVLITTETLGRGDDTLGTKLMENFLATLPELGSRLWRLVLVNGGVKLTARPGPALDSLQKLAQQGVSILVCGACLGHYGLLEAKAVGETSNMLDIVTSMDMADKIIRP
ncbi:MAG: SirA family protein [Desulfovibrio sp. MES5]|uniref:sulfurtransferase-like selenium metabolism protein YedF n=1 Tax=Desulfovibrio sp. MES5 TaxID=1899016 RepID=UPI000B9CA11D|nr:sulfurtransferase-like selenium metabolism protein YedF [Desulfovibrio sp. MES5]OXS30220.1 MAG: SirA family protein [Desulfovibrio sp. MES5]